MWGLVENGIWGRLSENVRIPSYGGRGLKLLKNRHKIFELSPKEILFFASKFLTGSTTSIDQLPRFRVPLWLSHFFIYLF